MYKQKIILIPYWVEKALSRNDMALSDILDYSKIRNIMSITDVALLLSINRSQEVLNILKIGKVLDLGQAFSSWQQTAQGEHKAELDSVLPQLLCSVDSRSSVVELLSEDSSYPLGQNQPYKLADVDKDTIGIVLYRGFIEAVNNKTNQSYLTLLMSLITKLYSLNNQSTSDINIMGNYNHENLNVNLVHDSQLFLEFIEELEDCKV